MSLAEAKGLLSFACFEELDPRADLLALQKVAAWCQRFSPVVGIEDAESPDTLLLDITGCTHLFENEHKLADQVGRDFEDQNLFVRVAIADTVGAAWAMAHFGANTNPTRKRGICIAKASANTDPSLTLRVPIIAPPNQHVESIASLPIEALRLSNKIVHTLYELGIQRIEQLQSLPRAALPSRFGPTIIKRLDQASGQIQELIIPQPCPDSPVAERLFEHPIRDHKAIVIVIKQLLTMLIEKLTPRQEGILRLRIVFSISDAEHFSRASESEFSVGVICPSLSVAHLTELATTRLEYARLTGEVSKLRVHATATAPLASRQEQLFESDADKNSNALAQLIDRLSTRLGEAAVLRPRLQADAQPEYAFQFESLINSQSAHRSMTRTRIDELEIHPAAVFTRPIFLKPSTISIEVITSTCEEPPTRFRWNGCEYIAAYCWGPERIETGWWRGKCVKRDYYQIETTSGQRFWLFLRREYKDWLLHGEF